MRISPAALGHIMASRGALWLLYFQDAASRWRRRTLFTILIFITIFQSALHCWYIISESTLDTHSTGRKPILEAVSLSSHALIRRTFSSGRWLSENIDGDACTLYRRTPTDHHTFYPDDDTRAAVWGESTRSRKSYFASNTATSWYNGWRLVSLIDLFSSWRGRRKIPHAGQIMATSRKYIAAAVVDACWRRAASARASNIIFAWYTAFKGDFPKVMSLNGHAAVSFTSISSRFALVFDS